MRTRIALTGMVAATAVAISLFGGVFAQGSSPAGSAAARPATRSGQVAARGVMPGAGEPTRVVVAELQARARANPHDALTLTQLGLAYQQRARETADPTYYPKADGV